jgi:hypothetical protein
MPVRNTAEIYTELDRAAGEWEVQWFPGIIHPKPSESDSRLKPDRVETRSVPAACAPPSTPPRAGWLHRLGSWGGV